MRANSGPSVAHIRVLLSEDRDVLASHSRERKPPPTVRDRSAPNQVPLYDLVLVKGPEGQPLDAYRGVRRRDTSEIVSVVNLRVNAERARGFERTAASDLLSSGPDQVPA